MNRPLAMKKEGIQTRKRKPKQPGNTVYSIASSGVVGALNGPQPASNGLMGAKYHHMSASPTNDHD